MKFYIDDIRNPPDDTWKLFRRYEDFISWIRENSVHIDDFISMDHDMGDRNMTGYDFLKHCMKNNIKLCSWENLHIHSANPVGRNNMQTYIDRYY